MCLRFLLCHAAVPCGFQVNPLPFDREKLAAIIARRQEKTGESKRRPHMTPAAMGLGASGEALRRAPTPPVLGGGGGGHGLGLGDGCPLEHLGRAFMTLLGRLP
jgi:hypothetical protein